MVMVVVILLAISSLTIGFFRMRTTVAVETVYVDQSSRAFWLAEAGLQRALHKLRREKSFRDNPYLISDTVGDGGYNTSVSTTGTPDTWSIASTGTVRTLTRIVTLDPLLTAEVGYAIMGLNGDSTLNNRGYIEGNVYNFGEIDVNGRASPSINGDVLALDAENMDFSPLTENDRVEMTINDSYGGFDFSPSPADAISYIRADPDGDGTTNRYINLTGANPVVVNNNLTVAGDVIGTYGDGTLVVNGELKFSNSTVAPYAINDGATILVRDGIFAQKEGYFGSDVIVYTTGDMKVQKTGSGESTTFLVEGDFTADNNLTFKGLIFVEGSVQVDGDLNMEGSLIAGSDFWLKKDYNISYEPGYIPQDVLDNMILYVVYATSPGTWNEVPAL